MLPFQTLELMSHPEARSDQPLRSDQILLCSAIAKMTASIATYPHEVVRTRLQTQRRPLSGLASSDGMKKNFAGRGIIYTTKKIIALEGWSGLYRGLSINLLRTVPNSAVTMLTCVACFPHLTVLLILSLCIRYELLMRRLNTPRT